MEKTLPQREGELPTSSYNARESERLKSVSCWFAEACAWGGRTGHWSVQDSRSGLRWGKCKPEGKSGRQREGTSNSCRYDSAFAEGIGELELAVVFIPFGDGTEDLDGVLGAAGIAVVTLAASTSSGSPMFNRSSSTDSTGVVGKAHPEGVDDEVERVLVEGTGLRPARVEGLGCEGRTGSILVSSRLIGVGGMAGYALSVC